jgi:hypothetical protein
MDCYSAKSLFHKPLLQSEAPLNAKKLAWNLAQSRQEKVKIR